MGALRSVQNMLEVQLKQRVNGLKRNDDFRFRIFTTEEFYNTIRRNDDVVIFK
jgi:hypothetical protein